jgi:hypothetical protein
MASSHMVKFKLTSLGNVAGGRTCSEKVQQKFILYPVERNTETKTSQTFFYTDTGGHL